jgi:drug/metabolite transporter (DMT)-like permease
MKLTKVTRIAAVRRCSQLRVLLAFAAIYLLWGATFLAIRIAVRDLPPLFASGVRFLIAGTALYVFMRARGEPSPLPIQWRGILAVALSMFVATYAALFWAEQYVPSGVTSIIEATLPMLTAVLEVFVFRLQRFHWRTALAIGMGFFAVAWLVLSGDSHVLPWLPCVVILAASAAWSLGAVYTRTMPRPASAPLTAGAQMMLGGVILLALSHFSGELQVLPHVTARAALALAYLIVGGSLLGFTAYIWLLARMPATQVASHAYVNPLVAVGLGYFLAGEVLTLQMLCASALVIASVFVLLTAPQRVARLSPAEMGEAA